MALKMDAVIGESWNSSICTGSFVCSTPLTVPIPVETTGIISYRGFVPSLACKSKRIVNVSKSELAANNRIHNGLNLYQLYAENKIDLEKLTSQRLVSADLRRNITGISAIATTESTERKEHVDSLPVSKLSDGWREIQGAKDWNNLLDPLDPMLKVELIKYGEFAQLCYDAFDYDSHSEFCGSCRFNPRKLLKEFGLRDKDYEITKYLYATSPVSLPSFSRKSDSSDPWSTSSNWIGFVAVSSSESEIQRLGRRDIIVAWRGTVTQLDWLTDLEKSLCPSGLHPHSISKSSSSADVRVETGFLSLYTTKKATARYNKQSPREQVLSEIQRLEEIYRGEELSISLTGHSLGAALALLCGYDLAESGLNMKLTNAPITSLNPSGSMSVENTFEHEERLMEHGKQEKIPITVFSFAGPRVGNSAFCDRVIELGVKVLRVVNVNDLVPKVPGVVLNEKFRFVHDLIEGLPWTYSHVGVELAINNVLSPFLSASLDPSCLHNLEAYMHLLDGFTSSGKEFRQNLSRDPALVNKNSDFLKKDLQIPGFWRQDKDKGLVKHPDGKLKFRGREPEDIPPYD